MKRFIHDLAKYRRYLKYAVKAGLKAEVANSRLSWMWWFLDPIFFMIVYTFISVVVFQKSLPYTPVYIFTGLTIWNFFSKCISGSVKLVKGHRSVLSRVYLPKWILTMERMGNMLFKMLISWGLVVILMIIWRVPFTPRLFEIFPLIALLVIITFGFSTLMLHFGVFMEDLKNIIDILLKLLFYLSGVFYNIYDRVPAPFNSILLHVNPAAFIMEQCRKIIIYQMPPDIICCFIWLGIGLLVSVLAVFTVYRYENTYAKVV